MNKKTLIFIIGAGHSGSTLLAKTLNAHSKIFALSEISNFHEDIKKEYALCGCETPLRKCPFWKKINKQLIKKLGFGIKDKPDEFRITRPLGQNSFFDKVKFRISRYLAFHLKIKVTGYLKNQLRNIEVLFDTIFKHTKADILVDSSKSPKRAYLLKNNLKDFDVKVIHLVRDGRAALNSYQKGYYKVKIKNPDTGKYEMKTYYAENVRSVKESIKIWKRNNLQALYFHKLLNMKHYYFLRYENFTSEPEKQLKKLLSFLGVQYESEMLNLNRYKNHMVSGNASRINAEKIEKPFNSWKNELNKEKIKQFERKAGWLNRKFGYK